ncbi:nitroreductase family protein [Alkalibaculum bacchi]|uniref:nitroreductase family protein n=1 Tax=Alkalibaculum bacchi TaxID=645887 RepID=UPI0026EAAF9E|nr:nitroreductase family protein [Alkalibaculum bacchi]
MKDFLRRRGVKKYRDQVIEQEVLDTILENALIAPTSTSRKLCEFIVITDREILKQLSACRDQRSQFLADAPAAIVVLSETEVSDVWIEDLTIAAYTIQLTAYDEGLGTCWTQIRNRKRGNHESAEDYIKTTLNIPDNYEVECIVSIGYSDEEKKPYIRLDSDCERIHNNMYHEHQKWHNP